MAKQRERERESNPPIDSATHAICRPQANAQSMQKDSCHTEALAEVSQLQIHNRDISASAKPQYDNVGSPQYNKESAFAQYDNNKKPQCDNTKSHNTTHLDCFAKQDFSRLSDDEKKEGYVFHILSDFVSEDSRTKLQNLAQELSKIYPCEVQIHICESTLFSGLPTLNGNYLAYFRLFIPRFMPSECKICLYLDIDMLVLGDLRGLFTLDMGDKCVGVVKDRRNNTKKLRPKSKNAKDIYFSGAYFNSGFLLLNIPALREQRVIEKCFEVMANYHLSAHDQDALNVAISESQRLYLPFAFNLLVHSYICASCKDEALRYKFDFTRESMNVALQNPVILHFAGGYKPWSNFWIKNEKGQILSDIWWEMALETPEFSEILKGEFESLRRDSHKIFESKVAVYLPSFTRSFVGFLRLPFVVVKIFSEFERGILESSNVKNLDSSNNLNAPNANDLDKLDSSDLSPSEYNFAFDLFLLAQKAYKRRKKGDLIILPFKAIKLAFRHKRYGISRVIKGDL